MVPPATLLSRPGKRLKPSVSEKSSDRRPRCWCRRPHSSLARIPPGAAAAAATAAPRCCSHLRRRR